jgi:hypothetical protein
MPTILRHHGFSIVIFLPPREHAPPHVHVRNASGEVVIMLGSDGRPQQIRTISGMRDVDVADAFWIVEEHSSFLLERWYAIHG